MKNPIKALAIVNTILLVIVVGVVILAAVSAKTETGEKVKFFPKREDETEVESKEA